MSTTTVGEYFGQLFSIHNSIVGTFIKKKKSKKKKKKKRKRNKKKKKKKTSMKFYQKGASFGECRRLVVIYSKGCHWADSKNKPRGQWMRITQGLAS